MGKCFMSAAFPAEGALSGAQRWREDFQLAMRPPSFDTRAQRRRCHRLRVRAHRKARMTPFPWGSTTTSSTRCRSRATHAGRGSVRCCSISSTPNWRRAESPSRETHRQRSLRDSRESRLWPQGTEPLPGDAKLIVVCDRGDRPHWSPLQPESEQYTMDVRSEVATARRLFNGIERPLVTSVTSARFITSGFAGRQGSRVAEARRSDEHAEPLDRSRRIVRGGRGEPASLRRVGLRRALVRAPLRDPDVRVHRALDAALPKLQPRCLDKNRPPI